ncbi:hypothetical protein ACOSQ4_024112 [Xanthoceras sorbifolium]
MVLLTSLFTSETHQRLQPGIFHAAISLSTGKLVWSTQLDHNPAAVITMSGTFDKTQSFYVGTSSLEEGLRIEVCCTLRGRFCKLDVKTGEILWKIFCVEPDNHSDSILALDLDSSKIKWYNQLGGHDVWFGACNKFSRPGCPPGPNPDADFWEAPMMLSIQVKGTKRDIVVSIQKSGFAWALDHDNGTLAWATEAGPGGIGGGGTWGAATDEKRMTRVSKKIETIISNTRWNKPIKPSNGSLVWKKNLQNLTGLSPIGLVANVNWTVSRATPTIENDGDYHDMLIIGVYGPAFVIAVKRSTGKLVWSTQLDHNPAAVITMSVSSHIEECQERENNQTVPTHPDECVEPDNHSDSILALDLDSSKIKWYNQLGGHDVWFGACNKFSRPGCPPGPNPDADFWEAPMMLSIQVKGTKRDIVVSIQKSGFAWALDHDNGTLAWATEAGPGGIGGGGTWGAATDEKRYKYCQLGTQEFHSQTVKPTPLVGGWQ